MTALQLRGISKAYGPTHALRGASFEVSEGGIHALVGGNGSGKSTLITILAGVCKADAGELVAAGSTHDARALTPAMARVLGFRFVHQHSTTFPDLSVAENLAIGHGFETGLLGRVHWRMQSSHAAATLDRFEIEARPSQRLGTLTAARQTMIAIARALQGLEDSSPGILVLDEPTAALPSDEVELLLGALTAHAGRGQTILYVSHRLEEVLAVADEVTVLTDGEVTATVPCSELTHDALAELIVGRALEPAARTGERSKGRPPVVLEATGLKGGAVRDATFELRSGEILGVAGLLGSGRSTLLRLLFGAVRAEGGTLALDGEPLELERPADAIDRGLAYVPEDRGADGIFGDLSVAENLSVVWLGDYWSRGRLHHRDERAAARDLMSEYGVRASSERAPVSSLSGGNQQKVLLARWMRRKAKVLLLDEPTLGVDVGARAEIYSLIRRAVGTGASILLVSSDTEELVLLSDRALIFKRGRVTGELEGGEISETRLNHLLLQPGELAA